METAGIICEYNPLHLGHIRHIEKTRAFLGGDCAIVCVMSGNYVQRGDFAVFNKHARAEAAVLCGADLVIELPTPYVLLSAEGFAAAGVFILDSLGICGHISFGSESGDVSALSAAANALATLEATEIMRDAMSQGVSYAAAQQKAADALLGEGSDVLRSPNNLLGIEYLKAIAYGKSSLKPMTIKRVGGEHDGDGGLSASHIRASLLDSVAAWELIPLPASTVYKEEIEAGRGPVSAESCDMAIMARLRAAVDLSMLPGVTEGLDRRLLKYAVSEPTVKRVLEGVKTKRYAMSRIRRLLMCACLGITSEDIKEPPPYIRVLAMNRVGMALLKDARETAKLPIITKPASVKTLHGRPAELFRKEAAATDFYVLAYKNEQFRSGGGEWRETPRIID